MCGITGFISNQREAAGPRTERLVRMCESIRYRGPDDQGLYVDDVAALGMRRLAIIDVDSGQQPITTDDGVLTIVFNGEIYNFRDVRNELEKLGHRFATMSDTEVVLHAFQEFGEECVNKLRGMFAFVVWNGRDRELFAARDRVGKKPFFYAHTSSGDFIFGSELKTLLTHGGIRRKVDLEALDAYLSFGYVPEEFCILQGVSKLRPGHFLWFRQNEVRVSPYWDFDLEPDGSSLSEDDWADEVRAKIKEAVEIRLISERPLGAFLSGGVDSSTIVAMMSSLSDKPVKTFSIGFREDSFDELRYARQTAERFHTDHHEFIVTPDLFSVTDEIVWHFDEPFADQSSLPTFMLSKMAVEHVTVVLTGDGGDELFAGYTRYLVDRARARFDAVPGVVRAGLMRPLSGALPNGALGKNFLYNVSLDPIDRYIDSVSTFNRPRKAKLYSAEFAQSVNGRSYAAERLYRQYGDEYARDRLSRLLYLDSKTYLPGDILTKVDRMTMANSLEARVPLLDHELIELVGKMPPTLKMRGGETKYILKKAMEGIVPKEILYREKQGFGVPVGQWINDQLRPEINGDLLSSRFVGRGLFDAGYVAALIDEHSVGRRDHSDRLWTLWMLELWFRRYIDA